MIGLTSIDRYTYQQNGFREDLPMALSKCAPILRLSEWAEALVLALKSAGARLHKADHPPALTRRGRELSRRDHLHGPS